MKRSKKRVSKRKDAKIKSKSRYGSRSKIKRVKSKKIKGGGIEDCQHGSEWDVSFTNECTTNITVNDIELVLNINFKTLHENSKAGYRASYIPKKEAGLDQRIKSLDYSKALNSYKELLVNNIRTKITSLDGTKKTSFEKKWNDMNLEAEITEDEDKEGIIEKIGNLFGPDTDTDTDTDTDYLKFKGTMRLKGEEKKKEHTIKLMGPSFNTEINKILAEINTKPAAQANASTTETQITTTNIPGIGPMPAGFGEIEF